MKIFNFILSAVLPVFGTFLFYVLDKNGKLNKLSYMGKQFLIGSIFGIFSILGTELGIKISGAIINLRNVAPLCAGLIFGAPAGIVSGVIGGAERWFSVYWGGGMYTRLACTLATVLAGLFAGFLRKYLFDNKKTSWYYGFIIASITEVFHMLLVFITNISDIKNAFEVVKKCTVPMVFVTSVTVAAALYIVSAIGKKEKYKHKSKKLTQSFQRWLFVCVSTALCLTIAFTFFLQTKISREDAKNIMSLYIDDVSSAIQKESDSNLLNITEKVAAEIEKEETVKLEKLNELKSRYEVYEINIIGTDGIINLSTTPDYIGFDMRTGEQSAEFLKILNRKSKMVQRYQKVAHKLGIYMKYAGVTLKNGNIVQIGYDTERFQKDVSKAVIGITHNRHVGENGYLMVVDENLKIVSNPNGNEGKNLRILDINYKNQNKEKKALLRGNILGIDSYTMFDESEGYYIIAALPVKEALMFRDISVHISVFMQIIVSASLFLLIYFLIKNMIVENIYKINSALSKITQGDLNVLVNVRNNEEFASLSDDINQTVDTLKQYIDKEAARIDKELEFARTIQLSSLPQIIPSHPYIDDFDIYAETNPAKEVGGDFFDFYMLGSKKLAFLVADVSGKGISAAMFMMRAKALIKGYAQQGYDVAEVLTRANNELCKNNEAEMFVTCWMGVFDLKTYTIEFANAGHNPPLLRHKDGKYEYFKSRPGFVLGGMEGIKYKLSTIDVNPESSIFLYTDGVTEATDANNQLYGDDRLLETLGKITNETPEETCRKVFESTSEFVGEAPQFDDITMLCLKLMPKNIIKVEPDENTVTEVTEFVENVLSEKEVPMKIMAKINIVIDEIASNIVRYSKATEMYLDCEVKADKITLIFADNGIPYNSLLQPEPDITLNSEERQEGGLGIFMVKKIMDKAKYEFVNGRNILKLSKKLK